MEVKRRPTRLPDFDYTQHGAYFVTICASRRGCVLGRVHEGEVILNARGRVAAGCLDGIPDHHRVGVDVQLVMPDHIHVVVLLPDRGRVSLSTVVATYKAAVTRATGAHGLWQRGFYDHIVRNQEDLDRIRWYVLENPARWSLRDRPGPDVSGPYADLRSPGPDVSGPYADLRAPDV